MRLSQSRAFLLLRYTLIAATAYLLLVEESFAMPRPEALLLIAAALTSNVAFSFLPERLQRSTVFSIGVILADTTWVTAVLLLSGRFSAEFFYLYFFVLLLAAVGESLERIALAAFVLCGFYLYGHVASGGDWELWASPSLIRLPFLFAAAIFYGYLIDRTRHERRRADASEEIARQLERALGELRVAYGKSQESDRTKSTFLATVSHELRTPLVAIIGYIDLLLEGVYGRLQPDQEEALTRVQLAGSNLYEVIAGLLDASRLDLGSESVDVAECDLNRIVEDLSGDYPGSRSVRIYYPKRIDMAPIHTDGGKLRRILGSLVDNAVKFTEHGVVTVDARWDPARDRVEFRVSDTGPGIPEEQLERIFEAFRQGAQPGTSRGIGLGLYIAKRLSQLLGGELSVTSTVGEGSTFTLALPRRPVHSEGSAMQVASLATH